MKPDLRVRVIYDLSDLTPYLTPECHLPRPVDVLADDSAHFAIKADLTDGFYHIPVYKQLRPYLGVSYRGATYRWARLPMSLSSAPALMQTVGLVAAAVMERPSPCQRSCVHGRLPIHRAANLTS